MSATDKQDWYFTFGSGQEFDGYYIVIKDATFFDARSLMVAKYGRAWSHQYNATDFLSERLAERLEKLEEL